MNEEDDTQEGLKFLDTITIYKDKDILQAFCVNSVGELLYV